MPRERRSKRSTPRLSSSSRIDRVSAEGARKSDSALRLMLPAMCNEVLIQLKSTSLASTITLLDITGVGRRFAAASYSTTPLLIAGAIYVVLTFTIIQIFKLLEHRLNRFQRT